MGYEYGYGSPQSDSFDIRKGEWHHFVMSKQEGLFVDDVLIATITRNFQTDSYPTFNINASFNNEITSNANGLYGMIKITSNGVENIIIPTADGFKNITTNEILSVKREGSYDYIEKTDDGKVGDVEKEIFEEFEVSTDMRKRGRFMFCTNCGAETPSGTIICPQCGAEHDPEDDEEPGRKHQCFYCGFEWLEDNTEKE